MRYPKIKVQLTGEDGNAFAIVGRVSKALERGGVGREERDAFRKEAMGGNYAQLLVVCMDWVDVS